MKICASKLPADTSDAGPAETFGPSGIVSSAHVMTRRGPGTPRGFGFVEMMRESGEPAVSGLDGQKTEGLALRVSESRESL